MLPVTGISKLFFFRTAELTLKSLFMSLNSFCIVDLPILKLVKFCFALNEAQLEFRSFLSVESRNEASSLKCNLLKLCCRER